MGFKRIAALWIAAILLLTMCSAFAEVDGGEPKITTEVVGIKKYGHLVAEISTQDVLAAGFEYGDLLTITVADRSFEMPLCRDYSDVDMYSLLCRLDYDPEAGDDDVLIAINGDDFATKMGFAQKIPTDEDPGYRWEYAQGLPSPLPVTIEIKEKGGYLVEYALHRLERSEAREDYPQLTDAEFANFREMKAPEMGEGILYRSSSPLNPQLGRNKQADAALCAAGVRTVVNLSEDETTMRAYEGFAETCYAKCNVIALNLGMDVGSESFRTGLAKGLRFMIDSEGPYLLHCNEGKDRTGIVCALLEALMGASLEEVCADYMESYTNYYGILPGSEKYELICSRNCISMLTQLFQTDAAELESANLYEGAWEYLRCCGLNDDEIHALMEKLAQNAVEAADAA